MGLGVLVVLFILFGETDCNVKKQTRSLKIMIETELYHIPINHGFKGMAINQYLKK